MNTFSLIIGGKAGEGTKKAGSAVSNYFAETGLNVFQMDDYQSLIKGGHNFTAVSTSTRPLTSHYLKANLVIVSDERGHKLHKNHIAENGILIYNSQLVHLM